MSKWWIVHIYLASLESIVSNRPRQAALDDSRQAPRLPSNRAPPPGRTSERRSSEVEVGYRLP